MTAETYPPAHGPRGVSVSVTAGQRQFSGELLEVRDSGLVILAAPSVTLRSSSPAAGGASSQAHEQRTLRFVPYGEILSSEVDRTSSRFAIKDRRTPDRNVRERLRLLSRFPQGLNPELLQLPPERARTNRARWRASMNLARTRAVGADGLEGAAAQER
jgi:hypothetical protein